MFYFLNILKSSRKDIDELVIMFYNTIIFQQQPKSERPIMKNSMQTCCPICAGSGMKAVNISDNIRTTITKGSYSGSGVMLGTSGLGLGVGGGTFKSTSTTQSRLEEKLDNVKLNNNNVDEALKMFFLVAFFLMMILMAVSFMPADDLISAKSNSPNFNFTTSNSPQFSDIETEMNNLIKFVIPIVIGVSGLTFIIHVMLLPKKIDEAAKLDEVAKVNQEKMDSYYKTIHYCSHCYVIYDEKGNYQSVDDGAVFELAQKAGIFSN